MECFEWWVVWKDLENLGEIFYFNVIVNCGDRVAIGRYKVYAEGCVVRCHIGGGPPRHVRVGAEHGVRGTETRV